MYVQIAGHLHLQSRRILRSLLSFSACNFQHSRGVSSITFSSHGIDKKNREIDFELLFKACTEPNIAKRLHALLFVSGKTQSIFVATRMVNIYAHLGDIFSSTQIFNQVSRKDAYTWNSMISAYVRNGYFSEAVKCAYEMLSTPEVRPDFHTFPPILKACYSTRDGARLHCWVSKMGFEWDVYVAASLVHMYCRFGLFDIAHIIFKNMPQRDVGCWNSVISGFCQNGNAKVAFSILDEMRLEGVEMDTVTVATILPICAEMNDFLCGVMIHLYVIKHGMEFDVFVSNALINMYAKFCELECAQNVFNHMVIRDLVSWNSIIAAYEQNDYPHDSIKFFHQMLGHSFSPDLLTIISLSSSIAQTNDLLCSKSIHGYITRRCWIHNDIVIGNAVVDMYGKLGVIDCAHKVFEMLSRRDIISWNTMITCYAQNGLATEAIEVYRMVKASDLKPNEATWVSILSAYAHLGALRDGMRSHGQVIKVGLHLDLFVCTCLMDLYGKCGRLGEAMSLFDEVSKTTSVPWNAMISCHGLHGFGETSLKLYDDMINERVNPDHVTFLSLLTACSHSGLVDQGKKCFDVMQKTYGIEPTLKHYGCMVDLYGRAGLLETAYKFINDMPLRPDASIWGALLGACRIHGNIEMGKKASSHLFDGDSGNIGYYVLMSNLYANFGKWNGVDEVRELARDRGLRKTPGWSSVELNNRIEIFYTGNRTHPQSEEIYNELAILNGKMKRLGYTPDYSFVLQDVEDDEKENILGSHSERLAIMYAILNTPPKTCVRIYKNLRVCGDCHNVTKFISKITEREIIVRDSNRFHHFKDGLCSCRDYW
ncbi:pentatricopeptide repeat-containing protein At4g33990-like [Henckelia pumila]|uniref:pentatricopeptide repeat-containing protein At4g33990-like n=1 Tax=Henckelia pumila TaxID=405737 RepID=UPI003C6E7B60